MQANLNGHNAFVTGGSRGIGRAIAIKLAQEGANVCVTARSADALAEVVAECENFGVKAISVVADASSSDELRKAIDTCVAELGGLSIVINNGKWRIFRHWQSVLTWILMV